MKAEDIRVGGLYQAKVGGEYTTVRVDRIRQDKGKFIKNKGEARYDCTILHCGVKVEFRSAAKFRSEVPAPKTTGLSIGPLGGLTTVVAESSKIDEQAQQAVEEGRLDDAEKLLREDPLGNVIRSAFDPEGEDSLPPTQAMNPATTSTSTTPLTDFQTPAAPAADLAPVTGLASRIASAQQGRQRGTPVAGMVPNEEQEEIIAIAESMGLEVRLVGGVLVICAGAGTGKTATLRMLEQILRGRGQYTAFNKSLVNEAKGRFTKCAVNTTHSLAFRAVGKLYAHRLDGERMRSGQIARILGIQPISLILKGMGAPDEEGKPTDKVKTLSPEFLAGQVMVAIRKFCQSADREIGPEHFKYIDGIDVPLPSGKRGRENNELVQDRLLGAAAVAWEDLTRVDGQLPFSPDVYVKIWQLGTGDDRPVIAADYILLDEAQDTAPVFLDILKQQRHALLVLVGDDNQQIYEWRGAVNAMGAFPGAPRRLLSQSYRFGQVVADVANTILAELEEPTDLVMRGLPTIPSRVGCVEAPRCYLYRTNAGAVGRVMQSVATGKRPHLIGGGSDVVAWCEAAMDLQGKRGTRHPELCCFDTWEEVEEYSKSDEGQELRLMVKLVNEFGAEEIRNALKDMPKEENADLVVSTAHKSKGREWNTVRLGPDFPTANKMADSDRRLLYVAVTRAKLTLDISECPPFCGGKDGRDTGSEEKDGWVPGLRVHYTVPMPTQEEQDAWAQAGGTLLKKEVSTSVPQTPKHPLCRHCSGKGCDKCGWEGVKLPDDPTARYLPENAGKPHEDFTRSARKRSAPEAGPESRGGFTWTKFDGGWFVRGPANTPINTSVVVSRKDGSSTTVTIRVVKHRFADAWIYGI